MRRFGLICSAAASFLAVGTVGLISNGLQIPSAIGVTKFVIAEGSSERLAGNVGVFDSAVNVRCNELEITRCVFILENGSVPRFSQWRGSAVLIDHQDQCAGRVVLGIGVGITRELYVDLPLDMSDDCRRCPVIGEADIHRKMWPAVSAANCLNSLIADLFQNVWPKSAFSNVSLSPTLPESSSRGDGRYDSEYHRYKPDDVRAYPIVLLGCLMFFIGGVFIAFIGFCRCSATGTILGFAIFMVAQWTFMLFL